MKLRKSKRGERKTRRAPQGARGLKYEILKNKKNNPPSRPARGAWVEMGTEKIPKQYCKSRPARGAWVEIEEESAAALASICRAPQGARGLKYYRYGRRLQMTFVAPRKGRVG